MTTVTDFTVTEATEAAVWLRPHVGGRRRRRVRVSWGLLEDLADESNPHNHPEMTVVYARVLAEAHAKMEPATT